MLMFAAQVVIYISTHKRWTSESENLVSTAYVCLAKCLIISGGNDMDNIE